jgi:hypothetical protein
MKQRSRACVVLMLCASSTVLFAKQAGAQCSARDAMPRHPTLTESPSAVTPPATIQSAASAGVWKTINVGAVAGKWALYRALDAADCSLGDAAERIFIGPQFAVSTANTRLDLVAVVVSALGIKTDTAPLKDIYSRARKLGFALAAAEVGPQLRLQYFDQPIGEFLNVAMEPIRMPDGESDIFVVGNGGAGLLLIGQDADANTDFHASSRFVFVRPTDLAAVHQ